MTTLTDSISADDLRSEAVEALRLLGLSRDDYDREEYLLSLLKVVFQRGAIAAGDRDISKNDRTLALIGTLTAQREAIRSATIEECAKVAEDLARKRRESESSRGFTSETATQVANTYWCEEIAESIRSLTKAGKGE